MEKWILLLMVGIVLIAILGYVLKSFFKVIAIGIVIFVLFKVGFVWSSDEITSNLRLDELVKQEYRGTVTKFLDNFVSKREENEVIDPLAVEAIVRESLKKATDESISKLSEMDVQAIVNSLKEKTKDLDAAKIDAEIDKLLEKYKTEGTIEPTN